MGDQDVNLPEVFHSAALTGKFPDKDQSAERGLGKKMRAGRKKGDKEVELRLSKEALEYLRTLDDSPEDIDEEDEMEE